MVQIYSTYTSERLKYILNYVFRERLGLEYTLLNDSGNVDRGASLIINYSDETIPGSLQILPQGILSETGIKYLVFDLKEQEDASILLMKPENQLYFDLFSAIFFLISRYEEYLMFGKDQHHRSRYQDSCLYEGNCLHIPLVDNWLMNFRNLLISDFGFSPEVFSKDIYRVEPTLDIDSVFAYKGRPFFRHLGAIIGDLLRLRFSEIGKRITVLAGSKTDPNDNFDFQLQALKDKGLKATYFFQVGPYGTYDKNISPDNIDFIHIIKKVQAAGHTIGLHPSYQSHSETEDILREKKTLENITGQPVLHSRQHFLKFELPRTYRNLLELGIREEHSMGYSEINGFRAGTAFPFYWFDLERNHVTELRIVPFCAMDVAYKQFGKLNPAESITESVKMMDILKTIGAPYNFIFHNESLSEHRGWQGWRDVFKNCLNG